MKIKKFKFNKNMYTNKYTTIILEKTKSFGLIYLAYYIRYDLESHKYPAYWHIPNLYHYSPKEYNCEMREIGRYLRLCLQRSNIFNIETKYQNLDNKYYLYNNKLIDINYNLYELNTKWLKEGEIIKKCIKKTV